jgi:3-oxoadipate enol-lactonase
MLSLAAVLVSVERGTALKKPLCTGIFTPRFAGFAAVLGAASILLCFSWELLRSAPGGPTAPLLPSPEVAGYVQVPGGRLFYETFGEGFPIVLIHDGICHREVWDHQVADLARDYRIVRYDRRGYGRSDMPSAPYSNLDDLHALVDTLKLERAVFIGSSAGGGLVIDYALAHPERVEALVLVGAVVNGLDYSFHMMRRAYGIYSTDLDTVVARCLRDPYTIAPGNDEARKRLAEMLNAYPQDVDFGKNRFATDPDAAALGRLSEIRVPTLIVTAEHDIPDVHAHAGAIEAGIAGSQRIVLDDGGHLVYLEQPGAFNNALREFFDLITLPKGAAEAAARAAGAWASFERGFVRVGTGDIYYEVMGKGEPLVLIHGGALDHRMWDDQFELFAENYRVVRYDVRGHGLTRSPYGAHTDYEELRALLDHLGIERAHLMGLSLGGRIVIDFAIEHPERVLKLIPVAPGISGYEFNAEPEQRCTQEIRAAFAAADFERAAEAFLDGWTVGPKRRPEEVDEGFRTRVLALIRENMRPGKDFGYMVEADPPALGRLAEIQAPTLVIVGDLDMPGILEIAGRIDSEVKDSKKVVIKGAAHTLNMEKPEKFNKAVLEFLGKN